MSQTVLRIRPFRDTDETGVVDLWCEVFAGDPARNEPHAVIRRKLSVQRELFFVGEVEGAVVGTVVAGFDGHRGWVYHLAVQPGFRRRGFGRALMLHAEASLRSMGCPKLNVQVRSANGEATAFYERLGYTIEERVSLGKILG